PRLYAERQPHCPFVFHSPQCKLGRDHSKKALGCVGDIGKTFATACTRAGYVAGRKRGGFVWHHLRNSAVTLLVATGTPQLEAMKVTGHRDVRVLNRYHVGDGAMQQAALARMPSFGTPVQGPVTPLAPKPRARRKDAGIPRGSRPRND